MFLLFRLIAYSQETIDAQRPTLTESKTIIEKNSIQFENGGFFGFDGSYDANTFVRFGVSNHLEMRVNKTLKLSSFQVGTKIYLWEGKDLVPGVAMIMSYDPIYFYQDYRLALTGNKGKFFYTLNGAYNTNWYGIVLLGLAYNKGSFFGEYQLNDALVQQVNAGVTYIIKNEVQLDVHGGYVYDAIFYAPYIGCGVSFRVK